MHTKKTVTRADEVRERMLLSIAHGQFAGGEEHHGPVKLQILGCEDGDVFRRRYFEAGRRADLFQDVPRSWNDVVSIAGRMGKVQEPGGSLLGARRRRNRENWRHK